MNKKIAIIGIVSFLLLQSFFGLRILRAQDATTQSSDAIKQQIIDLTNKTIELEKQKKTLSSQIQYMDNQIELINLQIQESTNKIRELEKEIDILANRTQDLDTSINGLTKMMLQRVVASYKAKETGLWELLLQSGNVDQLLNSYKYYKTAQEYNQKLLVEVQTAKKNYEEQKQAREQKKVELDALKVKLSQQNAQLAQQKIAKQQLLQDTQDSEAVYQDLLARARAQLSAFSSFVQSSGIGSLIGPDSLGKGSDGNYFSQRDSRWGALTIGNSSSDCNGRPCNVLTAGCLLTSIAMTLKKKGADINPGTIANNPTYFSANTTLMKFTLPNGLTRQQISLSDIDNQLNQGYVIAGINYGSCKYNSDHFVVLTKKDGNDYKMYDPLYGPDINFSTHYSRVCYAEVLR